MHQTVVARSFCSCSRFHLTSFRFWEKVIEPWNRIGQRKRELNYPPWLTSWIFMLVSFIYVSPLEKCEKRNSLKSKKISCKGEKKSLVQMTSSRNCNLSVRNFFFENWIVLVLHLGVIFPSAYILRGFFVSETMMFILDSWVNLGVTLSVMLELEILALEPVYSWFLGELG